MLNIHPVKTGSELCHQIKKYAYYSKFFAYSKISTLEGRLKKLQIGMLDSPDTRGPKVNPQTETHTGFPQ